MTHTWNAFIVDFWLAYRRIEILQNRQSHTHSLLYVEITIWNLIENQKTIHLAIEQFRCPTHHWQHWEISTNTRIQNKMSSVRVKTKKEWKSKRKKIHSYFFQLLKQNKFKFLLFKYSTRIECFMRITKRWRWRMFEGRKKRSKRVYDRARGSEKKQMQSNILVGGALSARPLHCVVFIPNDMFP